MNNITKVYSEITYLEYIEILTSLELRKRTEKSFHINTYPTIANLCPDKMHWMYFEIRETMYTSVSMSLCDKPGWFKPKYNFDAIKQLLRIDNYVFSARYFRGTKLQTKVLNRLLSDDYFCRPFLNNSYYNDLLKFLTISIDKENKYFCYYDMAPLDLNLPHFSWEELKKILVKNIPSDTLNDS